MTSLFDVFVELSGGPFQGEFAPEAPPVLRIFEAACPRSKIGHQGNLQLRIGLLVLGPTGEMLFLALKNRAQHDRKVFEMMFFLRVHVF